MRTVLLCPFTAGTVLWQGQDRSWTLTAVVRGTFSLVHGREALLADAQEPAGGDVHLGGDPRASLYTASDLVPYRPRADVTLVGSAFAPGRDPVEAIVARIALQDGDSALLDKSIGVIGDRVWIEGPDGLEPSEPLRFRSMSLAHERAARAPDNPTGFDLTRTPALGALALPNLEAVDDEIGAGRTVGLGPVLPHAPARRALLRPDGWAWIEGGLRGPVPPGFDFSFFNAAPRDQQVEAVRHGATLVLENLHREHPRLEVRLPSVRPKAFLVSLDLERGVEVPLRCDGVWIDTDRGIVTLSWRGLTALDASIAAPDEDAIGMLVVAAEPPGRELRFKQIEKILREGTSVSLDELLSEDSPLVEQGDAPTAPPPAPRPGTRPARGAELSGIWEELSSSDLVDAIEETSTSSRISIKILGEDTLSDAITQQRTMRIAGGGGPVRPHADVADYARVVAAIERAGAADALARHGLTMADLTDLERYWKGRMDADPALARAFTAALAAARTAPST